MPKVITVRMDSKNARELERISSELDRSQNWLLNEAWRRHRASIEGREVARGRMRDGRPLVSHRDVIKAIAAKR